MTTTATPGPGPGAPEPVPDPAAIEVATTLTRALATFGAASTAVGAVLATTARSAGVRAFGQQSAGWGAINLAIAGVGAWRTKRTPPDPVGLRRTLLVNAALDVGYIAAGAHVAHHRTTFGGRVAPQAARGHGWAVVLQGAGLLALDLGFARRVGSTPD